MSYKQQQELEAMYMMSTYGRKQAEFVRGQGVYLFDDAGKKYVDFLSGIGAVCVGHANEHVSQAIATQAHKLMHVGNYFYLEGRGELACKLSELLNDGMQDAAAWKSFFSNSGAEANEGAIKLARKYGKLKLNGAGTVLTAAGSFHGRTLATTAATGQEAKQESFAPMPQGFAHFKPNDIKNTIAVIVAQRALAQESGQAELAPVALMLECIQGESGVWVMNDEYLKELRAYTQEHGMLLMIDEVQTGFYRTGKAFSYMHAGIKPDVVSMAKGIANGFPCAALAATGVAAEVFVPGEHGSTFGGGPLAIAAATATLEELEALDVAANVNDTGDYFKQTLAQLSGVKEVRGKGLMVGITLHEPCAEAVANAALEQGMVVGQVGQYILRFLPPLIVEKQHIDELCAVLAQLLNR